MEIKEYYKLTDDTYNDLKRVFEILQKGSNFLSIDGLCAAIMHTPFKNKDSIYYECLIIYYFKLFKLKKYKHNTLYFWKPSNINVRKKFLNRIFKLNGYETI